MACEACNVKFNFFKRKKQCSDCHRYFCSECVIKRLDKILSCDSCGVLSRRPLVRSQIMQMRPRDLRQYLVAKNVSIKGCIEKDDLVRLLLQFANGTNDRTNDESCTNARSRNMDEQPVSPPTSGNVTPRGTDGARVSAEERMNSTVSTRNNDVEIVEIVEISENDVSGNDGPVPLVTEHDETVETSEEQHPEMFTEIPVWSDLVKLSDINELSDLEHLSVKQLKNLLSTNRVDYKGCVERSELLAKASRLWEQHKQTRTDVEKMDEDDVCKICWDAPIECVILECGHLACCINCGKQMSECPICKQYVVRVVRFFKA